MEKESDASRARREGYEAQGQLSSSELEFQVLKIIQEHLPYLSLSPCSEQLPPFPRNVPKNAREENRFGPLSPVPAMEGLELLINSHCKQI